MWLHAPSFLATTLVGAGDAASGPSARCTLYRQPKKQVNSFLFTVHLFGKINQSIHRILYFKYNWFSIKNLDITEMPWVNCKFVQSTEIA